VTADDQGKMVFETMGEKLDVMRFCNDLFERSGFPRYHDGNSNPMCKAIFNAVYDVPVISSKEG